jgi:uncharacterized protein (TIGR02001 family)
VNRSTAPAAGASAVRFINNHHRSGARPAHERVPLGYSSRAVRGARHAGRIESATPLEGLLMSTPASPMSCALFLLLATATGSTMAQTTAPATPVSDVKLSGHIDIVSRYYLRGITKTYDNGTPLGNVGADAPESERPALQWGVDYVHGSGFYLGYFGSQINYSYKQLEAAYADRSVSEFQRPKSIENDLSGGFTGAVGDFNYTLGGTYYVYINGRTSNAFETKLGISHGPWALTAQTLLKDVVWGNKGDTYWSLVHTQTLPHDIALTFNLGYYTYQREGKYLGSVDTLTGTPCPAGTAFVVNGCFEGSQPAARGFRHLIVGLSQPLGTTGLNWGAQLIVAGKNRYGISQGHRVAASLGYGF